MRCPRCGGSLMADHTLDGPTLMCIACGREWAARPARAAEPETQDAPEHTTWTTKRRPGRRGRGRR